MKPISDRWIEKKLEDIDPDDGGSDRALRKVLRELQRTRQAIRKHQADRTYGFAAASLLDSDLYRATLPEGEK